MAKMNIIHKLLRYIVLYMTLRTLCSNAMQWMTGEEARVVWNMAI